jgi:DNA helicase-2/ATP-dependent DNA helicase PcrA
MTMLKDSIFVSEELFLEKTLEKLRAKINYLKEACQEKENHLKELHMYLFEVVKDGLDKSSNGAIFAEIAGEESVLKLYSSELADYIRIENSPYFGKIVYNEESEEKDSVIYIGKKGINDFEKDEIPVIDWRAPISEVYYNCRLGSTSFQSPGGIINIDLKLKRTLKIKNSVLQNIYDADVVLNDDILIDYINQSKGLVLSDIVATIQKEQNTIIRKPLSRNLIVQGVAGSGKTTVAVHRVSYLMFNNKERLNSENVYIIAANPLFLNYITSMLPDLDVPSINQFTMQEILADEFEGVIKRSNKIGHTSNDVYDNASFIINFENFIKEAEDSIFTRENLNFLGFDLLTESQLQNIKNDKSEYTRSKAKLLDEIILTNLSDYRSRIIDYIISKKDNPEIIEKAIAAFDLEDSEISKAILSKNYHNLKKKYKNHFSMLSDSVNPEELFRKFTMKKDSVYTYNDIACRLLFEMKINGSPADSSAMHIVIDEAQDFTVVIYYFLRNLYYNASFTLVGDIMQSIEDNGIDKWDYVKQIFKTKTDYLEMNKGYRNTYEISMFAKNMAEYLTGSKLKIEPLNRHGDKVCCLSYNSLDEKKENIEEILFKQKENNRLLNAIICRDEESAEKAYELLKNTESISRINIKTSSLNYGSFIMTIKEAKGLEFDSVIIWDFDEYEKTDVKKLYVSMTRALHNLYVFTNNEKIALLSEN